MIFNIDTAGCAQRPARIWGLGNRPFRPRTLTASFLAAFLLIGFCLRGVGQAVERPTLEVMRTNAFGWFRLNSPQESDDVFTLQASTNLFDWTPIADLHDGVAGFADPASPDHDTRFYRVLRKAKTSTNDWKNQIRFPNDLFQSVPDVGMRWLKFAIPLADPKRVYYQDSTKYIFHYDFAKTRLDSFQDMTPSQFDQISLYTNNQQVLLGTILFPPYPNDSEYGIQFVGADPYSPDTVAHYFNLVQSTVAGSTNINAFYVPAYEQARSAETNRTYFESKGIRVTSAERWLAGNHIYATGWALGTLKFFTGTDIDAAFADGRLRPQDILLTDGVPAEIPVLAGVLSLTPSTPNSHVAILARSYGLPFAYLADAAQRALIQQLSGKDVLLRIDPYSQDIRVVEIDSSIDPALREEILGLKAPPKLKLTPKAKYGAYTAPTDNLTPADLKFFGGKGANFGFLRRTIPDNAHQAIAISFDLWDEFLDQTLPGGRTLRAEIQQRLSKYSFPPNMSALKKDLDDIRDLITKTARFTEAQKAAIIAALGVFDSSQNIRFRSSTNVEDTEQFSGAGLYDSYSGCLADDLDFDNAGPSICDPEESDERGVFRALQKVYASFYNDNAFLERLRHEVDEDTVGMAVLVHHSTPDNIELANGVATLHVNRGSEFDSINGDLVTQKGAVSVTNPDGNAQPEVVSGYHHSSGVGGFLSQRSSLVPLGGYVLTWQTEYIQLMNLFARVADAYHEYFPMKRGFVLDFEYKKISSGVLDVKQVREVPVNASTNRQTAFLLHQTNHYWVLQGEAADVFSNHRLKSYWSFQTRNIKLTPSNLVESLYRDIQGVHLDGIQTNQLAGAPGSFPEAFYSLEENVAIDGWSSGTGTNRRDFKFHTEMVPEVQATDSPVFNLRDFRVRFSVGYATPQPALQMDFGGLKPITRKMDEVVLEPRRALTSTNHLQQRTLVSSNVTIQTSFYWPAPPGRGGIMEKTAPLIQWKETRLEGLTSQPIVLRGDFSQTYRPGHHNFWEEFIFEPELESGLPASVLQELKAANIQLIHVLWNGEGTTATITILGVDGEFRKI